MEHFGIFYGTKTLNFFFFNWQPQKVKRNSQFESKTKMHINAHLVFLFVVNLLKKYVIRFPSHLIGKFENICYAISMQTYLALSFLHSDIAPRYYHVFLAGRRFILVQIRQNSVFITRTQCTHIALASEEVEHDDEGTRNIRNVRNLGGITFVGPNNESQRDREHRW